MHDIIVQPRQRSLSRAARPNALSETEAAGAVDAPVLTALLRTANTSARVLALCEAHQASGLLNATHVAAALHALGRVASSRGATKRESLKTRTQPWLTDARTQRLLQLAVQTDAAWTQAGHAPSSASDLVSALRGVTSLRMRVTPQWLAAWEALACERARCDSFPARELSGAVWCYATLGITPGASWTAVSEGLLEQCADELKPQELAAVCWSFGARAIPPRQGAALALQNAALRAAEQASHEQDGRMGAREAANILWGVARWETPRPMPSQAAWAGQLVASMGARLETEATPQEVANTVWALSKLCGRKGTSHIPPTFWLSFAAASTRTVPSMNTRNLCAVAAAIGCLRWKPTPMWKASFEAQVVMKAHKLDPHQARSLLYAWRCMAWMPPQTVVAAVQAQLAVTPPVDLVVDSPSLADTAPELIDRDGARAR